MQKRQNLQQLKQCYNDTFFSTQVSSHSPLNPQSSQGYKNFFRVSSKFKDQPRVYFQKIKAKKEVAESKFQQILRNNIKVRSQLQKIQRDVGVCKQQFLKLYYNKKFKLMESDILNEFRQEQQHNFRLSKQNFIRKKMYDQLSLSLRKMKKQRQNQMFRETKCYNQKIFRETLRMSKDRCNKIIFQNTERVRQHKIDLAQSKNKLRELSVTKSKFNYMSKINQQIQRILQRSQQLDRREDHLDSQIHASSQIPRRFGNNQN